MSEIAYAIIMATMAEAGTLPVLGVLTRTLVKSPVIKFIIPARIRHTSPKNDVIFVRNDSVEIKEVISERGTEKKDSGGRSAYLKGIIDKSDFDSSIRSARILGSTRQYEQEKDHQDIPSKPMELPPHILALTLESSKVVFLCAFYDWGNHLRWLSSYRILPDHAQSYSKRLGEHIAVDPKSRAMAVAANEGSFVLYALMPTDQLKEQVETVVGMQTSKFDPIMDVRSHLRQRNCIVGYEAQLIMHVGEILPCRRRHSQDGVSPSFQDRH